MLFILPNNSLSPVKAPKAPKPFGFDRSVAKVSVVVFASAVKLVENSSSKSPDSPDDLLYWSTLLIKLKLKKYWIQQKLISYQP